jgi:hypothetical protein
MTILLRPKVRLSVGDIETFAADFTDLLDDTEVIENPVVDELTTSDLTIANVAINVAQIVIRHRTIEIGKGLQFSVTGQKLGVTYTLLIEVDTDSTPARHFERHIQIVGV